MYIPRKRQEKSSHPSWVLWVYLATVVGLGLTTMHANVKSPPEVKRTLKEAGYREVMLSGYKPLQCGADGVSQGFSGKSPAGFQVTGVVCSGIFMKSNTIRTD